MAALLFSLLALIPAVAVEPWQLALKEMPLAEPVTRIDKSNAGPLLLRSFQSNGVIKAFILMPGCTDEFYFFEKARATLANPMPSLLDAVTAITNQTDIRATFRPPCLLLHMTSDPLTPQFEIRDEESAAKLRAATFAPHLVSFDKDWDYLLPILEKSLKARFEPRRYTSGSWHFYRHSLAAHGLGGWEALEAISLAGKTTFKVTGRTFFGRPEVEFIPDHRPGEQP